MGSSSTQDKYKIQSTIVNRAVWTFYRLFFHRVSFEHFQIKRERKTERKKKEESKNALTIGELIKF